MTSSGRMSCTASTGRAPPEAEVGQRVQVLDGLLDPLAVAAEVEREHHRLLDVVVVAALALAVLAQHVELVRELGGVEEVAGVGVLGDQPQRLRSPRRRR